MGKCWLRDAALVPPTRGLRAPATRPGVEPGPRRTPGAGIEPAMARLTGGCVAASPPWTREDADRANTPAPWVVRPASSARSRRRGVVHALDGDRGGSRSVDSARKTRPIAQPGRLVAGCAHPSRAPPAPSLEPIIRTHPASMAASASRQGNQCYMKCRKLDSRRPMVVDARARTDADSGQDGRREVPPMPNPRDRPPRRDSRWRRCAPTPCRLQIPLAMQHCIAVGTSPRPCSCPDDFTWGEVTS